MSGSIYDIGKSVGKVIKDFNKGFDAGKMTGWDKFNQGLDKANKIAAPIQAGLGLASFGMDIYNTIKSQQQAKEQLDLAKKNFNLELEKSQKQELAHNKLAASVDKAWGGEGKIADTIDYSQYKQVGDNLGGNGLNNGQNQGYIKDPYADSRNATNTANTESNFSGSGATPMISGSNVAGMTPSGYSDSIESNPQNNEETN